jgi:hypothetical protein
LGLLRQTSRSGAGAWIHPIGRFLGATGASAKVVAELARTQVAADERVETLRRIAQLISRGA